jgi:hypothetical protein
MPGDEHHIREPARVGMMISGQAKVDLETHVVFWIRTYGPCSWDCGSKMRAKPGVSAARVRARDLRRANTAVDSFGEVEAWLVEYGKGANLPPASQDLSD